MGAVIASGAGIFIGSSMAAPIHASLFSLIFLILLAIIAETQTIAINDENAVSITIAVILCALLSLGSTAAVWVGSLSVIGTYTKVRGEGYRHIFNIPPELTFFNAANNVIGLSASALVYRALGGTTLTRGNVEQVLLEISRAAFPLTAFLITSVLLNLLLIFVYMAIRTRRIELWSWVSSLLWYFLNVLFIGLFGVILTLTYVCFGWFLVLVLFTPFILARYVFSLYTDLKKTYLETVQSLAAAIEAKDTYTIGHSRRVEQYAGIIAEEMKLRPHRREVLKYAALLHDIGKIGIDEQILNKPSSLTPAEFREIMQHPEKGAHIIEDIEFLSQSIEIIRTHHERLNGSGYPDGLTAKEIPLESAILAVADCYDAMTSDRAYHKAMSHEEAVDELEAGTGTLYSPAVVKAFVRAMAKRGNQLHDI